MRPAHRISGAAIVAGIAGLPVAHSLSPVIHNAWLQAGGIDGIYVPFAPRNAAGFETLIAAGRSGLIRGLNVTAPFKEQAFALADEVSASARITGSANILVFEEGRVRADSSDGVGVLRALSEQAPQLDLDGALVVMLGAGGAARAAAGALIEAGARIGLLNRTPERAEALAQDLGPAVRVVDEAVLARADLVINALSIRPDLDLSVLPSDAVAMDMTYRPVMTPFLRQAHERGLATVDGLAMLIGQAAPSYQALFGQTPSPLDMREILISHLGEGR